MDGRQQSLRFRKIVFLRSCFWRLLHSKLLLNQIQNSQKWFEGIKQIRVALFHQKETLQNLSPIALIICLNLHSYEIQLVLSISQYSCNKIILQMKKLLSTLPSTKPDNLCFSQSSQIEVFSASKLDYQPKLQVMLNSLAQVIHIRSVLLPRDVQSIFSRNKECLTDLLAVQNADSLWTLIADKRDTQLSEDRQIGFLVKILQSLNQKRLEIGDQGNAFLSDQYRKLIEWYIPQIVKYQSLLASKKESQALASLFQKSKLRRHSFQSSQRKIVESFEITDKMRQEKILDRFKREQNLREREVNSRLNEEGYKVNPSLLLRQAKAKSLMKKLGPYRINKANPYEDAGYSTDINHTIQAEQTRRKAFIDNLKKVEKKKLLTAQHRLYQVQNVYWGHERDKMHISLENGKTELENHQHKLRENMVHTFQLSRKRKLGELKKTLEAYVKHEDSIKIKEILVDHEQKVRHSGQIAEVALSQRMLGSLPKRYQTICGKKDFSAESQRRSHDRTFQERVQQIMREEEGAQESTFSGRKSLVDMYDNSLKLV